MNLLRRILFIVFAIFPLIATSTPAQAQTQGACTPSKGGPPSCSTVAPASMSTVPVNTSAGNPINIITGNKYQQETDMPALPGTLGLEIVRHYNSAYSSPDMPRGIMGRGWRLSYETDLYVTGNTIQIIQADGVRLIFTRDPNNPSLCANPNPAYGKIHIQQTAQGDTYQWRWPNGRRLDFNSGGKLVQIIAPTGEFVSLQHDPQGWLMSVRDPQGRVLRFNYLDQQIAKKGSRYNGVQSIDSPVGRFSYAYGSDLPKGVTIDKIHLLANLVKVSIPTHYDANQPAHPYANRGVSSSSISRTYHYEDATHPTLLTGISISGQGSDGQLMHQRIGTYGYDINGKAILSMKANGAEKVTLDHSEGGITILTNSLGQRTTYKHAIIGGEYRLLEAIGPGCSSCSPGNKRYSYDKLGQLIEETTLNTSGKSLQTTKTERDENGRPIKISSISYQNGKAQAAKWQRRYAYQGTNTEPSVIAQPSVVTGQESITKITYNPQGQPTTITQSGWSPAIDGKAATPITRTTTYRYSTETSATKNTSGKLSLYDDTQPANRWMEIDGPLPNGASNSPLDSDITRIEYDAKTGLAVKMIAPGGFASTFAYDETGRLSSVKNAEGFATTFTHDARGQLISMRSIGPGWIRPLVSSYRYDAMGNRTETGTGDTLDHTWRSQSKSSFDALGRLVWQASALGILNRYQYDNESRLIETARLSASMTQAQRYAYDVYGNLTKVWNNTGASQTISDSDQSNSEAQAAAPSVRKYTDDFGRVVATISTDSGITTRTFDAADHLIASSDALKNHASYAYDVAGRIIKQTITDSATHTPSITQWQYQGKRLIALHHPNQSELYQYDARGLLVTKTIQRKQANHVLTSVTHYTYDDDGVLQSTSLPDGSNIVYERNGQGQIVALKRNQIATSWLQWLLPAKVVVNNIERDLIGVARYIVGNGIQADYQRSKEGVLAKVAYQQSKTTLMDTRYWWDARGNLLHTQNQANTPEKNNSYAYDAQNRLIVAASKQEASRYFYDTTGNRLLSQQGIKDQRDLQTNTIKTTYQSGSNRNVSLTQVDATGQPQKIGQRAYAWNALGQLTQVKQDQQVLASYRYNHRGERISKEVGQQKTSYLYEDNKLVAEMDSNGHLTRQYIYLGDQPIAVIDTPKGKALQHAETSLLGDIATDIATIFHTWLQQDEHITYLHANHLGAIEAATNPLGELIWQANYHPFGKISITSNKQKFDFKLRLPGQYEDEETGLYYNGQRYYDPQEGRYLTPDPLGMPDGPNSYVYVRNNPLKYIDPSGLILFAFDGTNNANPPPGKDDFSNVYKFYLAYDDGRAWYMNGVGRDDPDSHIQTNLSDAADANTARARVDYMLGQLDDYMSKTVFQKGERVNIDITGFSRGAAMARDFSNRVAQRLLDNAFSKSGACAQIRFMGLWDTVAQFGVLGIDNKSWQLAIPTEAKYVFQAVALNEHRRLFPGEAIGRGTQKGFIGSHADIGGSYGTGDLSDVALNWIVEQAKASGVKMKAWKDKDVNHPEWGEVTNPVLHDKSNEGDDRVFCLRDNNARASNCQKQKQATPGGMMWSQTQGNNFINLYPESTMDADGSSKIIGQVNMKEYAAWLKQHYGLDIQYSVP